MSFPSRVSHEKRAVPTISHYSTLFPAWGLHRFSDLDENFSQNTTHGVGKTDCFIQTRTKA
ncbi:MAG TPA: hypothetical protein DEB39_03335 [Planctomycetaceae bacterium]|nr:hypothetical protein [Planctomycetaceae bacterium]